MSERVHAEPCGRVVFAPKNLPSKRLRAATLSCHSRSPHCHCTHPQRLADRPPSSTVAPTTSARISRPSRHEVRPWRCCGGSRHRRTRPGPRRRGLVSYFPLLPPPGTEVTTQRSLTSPRSWISSEGTSSRPCAWTGPWCAPTGSRHVPRPVTTCGTHVYHKAFGGGVQLLPTTRDTAPVEPGSTHDITTARPCPTGSLYRAASLGPPTLVDKSCTGAGIGIKIPVKNPHPDPDTGRRNELTTSIHAPALQTAAWNIPRVHTTGIRPIHARKVVHEAVRAAYRGLAL